MREPKIGPPAPMVQAQDEPPRPPPRALGLFIVYPEGSHYVLRWWETTTNLGYLRDHPSPCASPKDLRASGQFGAPLWDAWRFSQVCRAFREMGMPSIGVFMWTSWSEADRAQKLANRLVKLLEKRDTGLKKWEIRALKKGWSPPEGD